MRFPELLRIILVVKYLVAKLLAGQVKAAVTDHIVAVVVSIRSADSIYPAAENVLQSFSAIVSPTPVRLQFRCSARILSFVC